MSGVQPDLPTDHGPLQPGSQAQAKLQQPMSLQNAIIMSLVTALLGGGAAGGGLQLFGQDLREDLQEVRHEVRGLNTKLDEIYRIVDRAHPRNIGPAPRREEER